jgi:hypothetical protein
MNVLGKVPALRRRFHSNVSVSGSLRLPFSLCPSSSAARSRGGGAPHALYLSTVAPAGGKAVSEFIQNRSTQDPKRVAWSAWEVAGVSCLAISASLGMIAYPSQSVQNEPAVKAATAHQHQHHHQLPSAGRSTVSFVQRNPNRMHNLVLENQQSAEQTPFRETVQVREKRRFDGSTSMGRPYDVSSTIVHHETNKCKRHNITGFVILTLLF